MCHTDHPPTYSAKYFISASLRVIDLSFISTGKISYMSNLLKFDQPNQLLLLKRSSIWLDCFQGNLTGGRHRLALEFESHNTGPPEEH